MKILIVGGDGQLGQTFRAMDDGTRFMYVPPVRWYGAKEILRGVRDIRPDAVINCTAWTDVTGAELEENFRDVFDLNTFFPANLAAVCGQIGARFVTFSTDYVFDGKKGVPYAETDTAYPLNVYGKSKRTGESLILCSAGKPLIIRTAGLFSPYGKNFVKTILNKLAAGGSFFVTDRLTVNLTDTESLARAVLYTLDTGLSGIFHFVNSPPVTWYEAARVVESAAGKNGFVLRGEVPDGVLRPEFSALGCTKIRAVGIGIDETRWESRITRTVSAVLNNA